MSANLKCPECYEIITPETTKPNDKVMIEADRIPANCLKCGTLLALPKEFFAVKQES